MVTKLDRLLMSLAPSLVYDGLLQRAFEALNTYEPLTRAMTPDRGPICTWLVGLVAHLDCHLLRLREPAKADGSFAWARCVHILDEIFGPSGTAVVCDLARTGNEGGLAGVARRIAFYMVEHHAKDQIQVKINVFWDNLSDAEKLDAPEEYLRKWGHVLPGEMTEGSAARVRGNFPRVLEAHVRMLRRFQKVGPG